MTRVLHVCPLWYPVADDAPGGIETLLAALVRAQVERGCQVAVLASGDSHVDGELIAAVESNLYDAMQQGAAWEYEYYEQRELLMVLERAGEFDVIHSHVGPAAYVLSGVMPDRVLHTHHRQVSDDLRRFVEAFPELWIATVSRHQAAKIRGGECHVVPNGIETERFEFGERGGHGLVYLGRIEPEKGTDLAIETARAVGAPLTIAGRVTDPDFFARAVQPFLRDGISYAGVLDQKAKTRLLARSSCALVPSRWEEPFGLAAVEAMACGTPVVATRSGALPELVAEGVSGFLADEPAQLPELVRRARGLDRRRVRDYAVERFDIGAVAEAYLRLYESGRG